MMPALLVLCSRSFLHGDISCRDGSFGQVSHGFNIEAAGDSPVESKLKNRVW